MAPRTAPLLRRPFAILALIGLAGMAFAIATFHLIPPRAMTLTTIEETGSRIDVYVRRNNRPPQSLKVIPNRDGYMNGTTDGWKRPLIYSVLDDDTFTLMSYGADGLPGGTGDDEDVVRQFRVVRYQYGAPHVEPQDN